MSKSSGRKSILANFASFTPQSGSPEEAEVPSTSAGSSSRAAGVIGATQRSLSELREERDRLRALVEAGGEIALDPDLVDSSPFPDRLNDDNDDSFNAFKTLIETEGQLTPILVRRHPTAPDRYQVAYGHRRLRAARALGRKVKAKIEPLDDRQLVVAQGMENSARQDLSWIEKALFAAGMESTGLKARDIRAALGVDDPELARFRAVYRAIPDDIMRSIGRAPKAGRSRWAALAHSCVDDATLRRVRETLAAAKVSGSDDRFVLALNAATARKRRGGENEAVEMTDSRGRKIATGHFLPGEVKIHIEQKLAPDFAQFLQGELPSIIERYDATKNQ